MASHSAPVSEEGSEETKSYITSSHEECTCKCYIDDAMMIFCDTCQQWYHAKCVKLGGLTKEMIEKIKDYECPFCIVSAAKLAAPVDHSIRLNSTSLKQTVATVVQNTLKEELASVLEVTKKDIVAESSRNVKSYVEAVKVDIKSVIKEKPSCQLVKEAVRQIDADQIERVKRECNVVINHVPENIVNGKHSKEHDCKFLQETCGFQQNEVVSCFRAGKVTKSESSGAGNKPHPRPLVVRLKSKEDAMWWCDNGKGWKVEPENSGDPNNKEVYWINQDLNRADREAQFLVRQERRNRLKEKVAANQNKLE